MVEKGLIQTAAEGFGTGTAVGLFVGSCKAYLQGLSHAQAMQALEAAKASARPPTGAALAAMTPTPPGRIIATTTALFAAVGTLYTTSEPIIASMRGGQDDVWNRAAAGCVAGSAVGFKSGSVGTSAGACAAMAGIVAFTELVSHGNDASLKRKMAVYGVYDDEPKVIAENVE